MPSSFPPYCSVDSSGYAAAPLYNLSNAYLTVLSAFPSPLADGAVDASRFWLLIPCCSLTKPPLSTAHPQISFLIKSVTGSCP